MLSKNKVYYAVLTDANNDYKYLCTINGGNPHTIQDCVTQNKNVALELEKEMNALYPDTIYRAIEIKLIS